MGSVPRGWSSCSECWPVYSQPCRTIVASSGAVPSIVGEVAVRVSGDHPADDVMEVVGPDAVEAPAPLRGVLDHRARGCDGPRRARRPGAAPTRAASRASSATMWSVAVVDAARGWRRAAGRRRGYSRIQCSALSRMNRRTHGAGAVQVDRRPHGARVPVGEVARAELRQVRAFGPEMVVDDVEHHGEPVAVRGVDERAEIVRACRRRATARTARRRRSPSCGCRRSRRRASARPR